MAQHSRTARWVFLHGVWPVEHDLGSGGRGQGKYHYSDCLPGIWLSNSNYQGGNYQVTQGKVVGLFVGLLMFHGILVGTLTSGWFLLASDNCSELPCDAVACAHDNKLRLRESWGFDKCVHWLILSVSGVA